MRISLLCSDPTHPVNDYLNRWIAANSSAHDISLVRSKADLPGGDVLFLVSCSEIIRDTDRLAYGTCLVIHASDLPLGRGWSPHIWEIVNGARKITVTLLEAADSVDSGRIWKKISFAVQPHALWNEINSDLFQVEVDLINYAVENYQSIQPVDQSSLIAPTYYRRRSPEDSRIDPTKSLASQFDLLRVCDPKRFPAFFELDGHVYKLTLERVSGEAGPD